MPRSSQQLHPHREPVATRHAATVLLLRDAPDQGGLEVLMTRRSATASFAPGAYVFPGGGIDALEWESPRSKEGTRARDWLRTKANSIEGGTSEVMLGIVAKRILDLPGA